MLAPPPTEAWTAQYKATIAQNQAAKKAAVAAAATPSPAAAPTTQPAAAGGGAGKPPATPAPTSQPSTQPSGVRFGDAAKLQDHFARRGNDFGAKTASEYEQQANGFLTSPKGAGVLEKVRANGDLVRYNPATGEFGVLAKSGTIRTYYKPDPKVHGYPTNLDYYSAQ